MNRKTIRLILALLFPVMVWAVLVGEKTYGHHAGTVVTLPVSGYDPRDLLSGHYIIYEIDYGAPIDCELGNRDAYLYLDSYDGAEVSPYPPDETDNALFIKGHCQGRRFVANIERFYVPEDAAPRLDSILRGRELAASIEVSINRSGRAQVKNFLLNGQPWQEALRAMDEGK